MAEREPTLREICLAQLGENPEEVGWLPPLETLGLYLIHKRDQGIAVWRQNPNSPAASAAAKQWEDRVSGFLAKCRVFMNTHDKVARKEPMTEGEFVIYGAFLRGVYRRFAQEVDELRADHYADHGQPSKDSS